MHRADQARFRLLLCACGVVLSGCAAPGGLLGSSPTAPTFREPGLAVATAAQRVVVGQSTRADASAMLGSAETLRFEGGHEVWVYRAAGARNPAESAELVILFGPDGVARKVRARPASAPR